MTYEEFLEFIPAKCMYETIYDDSDGRPILVIRMLDAYGMVNKLTQPTWFIDSKLNPPQRTWVGLTAEDRWEIVYATERDERTTVMELVEAKLKLKNNPDCKLAQPEQHGKCKHCTDGCPACDARKLPEQHQDWCASLTQMLMSMPPKPAPCNCNPKENT
jgi:hypothetical protein